MAKAAPLTKTEIFYIQENPENKTIHELAEELNRSPKVVAKHFVEKKEPEPVREESALLKLMGRHKRNDKNVATVMTKAASELADNTRPNRLVNKKLSSAIHRPMGE